MGVTHLSNDEKRALALNHALEERDQTGKVGDSLLNQKNERFLEFNNLCLVVGDEVW